MKNSHTTKRGPGRRHAEGDGRKSIYAYYPVGNPGNKLQRKAIDQRLTKRH
jgi:hypothetical protein